MIRIEAVWLCIEPMDMRAGADTTLARVVRVFGAAHPQHAYVFANKRSTRLKVLVHDGIGIWLAARRLYRGRFVWPGGGNGAPHSIAHFGDRDRSFRDRDRRVRDHDRGSPLGWVARFAV